jgi:transcriptional regulator with XRE-family HTH domain
MVAHPPSWLTVLQDIVRTTAERQRLATALGVTNMTLTRWASGESRPQKSHVIRLVQVVHPQQRQELLEGLEKDFPELQSWLNEDNSSLIRSEFFAEVLTIRTTTTENLLFWRISEAILKQVLAQLDPNNLGMAVKLVQCMPPSPQSGKVRSLRERVGKGTPPWTSDPEHDVLFLGLESLSGYAVEARHIASIDDLRQHKSTPAYRDINEISAAAHPIRLEGKIAGCLLVSSTQAGYFTQQKLSLLAAYSDLFALAFSRKEFYPPDIIELRALPRPQEQRPIIAQFRTRVMAKSQQAIYQRQQLSNTEIELQTWQEIEEELLNLADDSREEDELL